MATTTNYGWTTPDDTALVKDGASAIRTLGTSVDTTTKNLNPETTLGDIAYRSSTANTNTRLGIGTTGQVLTVAGGVPSWATAAGGTANWSLLNAGGTALTGAQTITVSGISSKDKVFVLVDQASAGASSVFTIRFNADSGANYKYAGQEITMFNTYAGDILQMKAELSDTSIKFGKQAVPQAGLVSGGLTMTGCNASGNKVFQMNSGSYSGGSYDDGQSYNVQGVYDGSSTISSVSIISSVSNFDGGTIYVYTSA